MRLHNQAGAQMRLQLNAGDWATFAFFALAVMLGCYAESERARSAPNLQVDRGHHQSLESR